MARQFRKPLEALDQHVDLITWWRRNAYAASMAEAFQETHPVQLPEPLDKYLSRRLDSAATIFVTSEITDHLWEFAKAHDPLDLNLHVADLFLDNGYVWFEHPLLITDIRGRVCTIRVIAWFRESDRLRIFYFNDRLHPLDELTREAYEEMGADPVDSQEPRTPLFHHEAHDWESTMFADFAAASTDDLAELTLNNDMKALQAGGLKVRPADNGAWYFTYNYEHRERIERIRDQWHFAVDPLTGAVSSWFTEETLVRHQEDLTALHRFMLVLWNWMGDHMPGIATPDRPTRRRLMRAKLGIPGEVLVIDLRTQDPDPFYEPPGSPQLVMWNHRWRQRGHWRHYRNKVTGEVIKTVWVRESIKGPDHLPLIEKDSVFNVRR